MDLRNDSYRLATKCSCDNCDTLRCLTRKYGLFNDEKYDTHCNKCLFITDIALTKPPFEKSDDCKKELVFSDGLEQIKTKKSQCKYCNRYVESQDEVNEFICNICKAYLPEDKKNQPWIFKLCKNFIRPSINKITMQIPDSVKTKRIRCKYCKGYVDFHQEMIEPICNICKAYIPKENICNAKCRSNICKMSLECPNKGKKGIETKEITKSIPTDCKHTVEARYKICEGSIEELETCKTFVCHKPKMTKIHSNKSLCKYCKINALSCESKHRKDKSLSSAEDMKTKESKCKMCTTGIKEYQATVDKRIEFGKDLEKHSCNVILCRNCTMHSTGNETLAPEEMRTGKSNCKICRRFVDQWEETMSKRAATYKKIIPLCEFCRSGLEKKRSIETVKKKIKCNGCTDIPSVGNTENTPPKGITNAKSLCQLYKKDIGCKGKSERLFTKKSKCAFCRRDIENIQVHCGVITQDDKECQFCQLNAQPQNKEIETPKKLAEVKIKSCDSVNNKCHESEDIHPSTLKLSAQVMNVPYDEFKASLGQQISNANKSTMKSTLSHDITRRIKEAYKACSCKLCECVLGKSHITSNVCSCKPCDCLDCKSYNFVSESKSGHHHKVLPRGALNVQNQLCECTPCSCIQCRQIPKKSAATAKPNSQPPGRTYIVATVSENQHAANCTCTTCHCEESLRSFFSLPTHVTHDMSTGIVRNCRCEQCVDQRCMGAGGTNECRCEMPSKPIFKPVEKDSHDYDIHRTAICHQRNNKNDCHEPIAMYASVCSKYSQQKNVGEARKWVSCECKNSKMSIKDTLINQLESTKHIPKSGHCTDVRNIPDSHLANSKNADSNCDICNCVNCHTTSKYMIAESNPLTKSTGNIYYRHDENGRIVCKMQGIKENSLKNEDHTHYCSDTKIFTATTFSQDLSKNISSQYNVANKYVDNNLSKDVNSMNYSQILTDFTNSQSQSKKCTSKYLSNEYPGTSGSTLCGLKHTNFDENSEFMNKKVNLQPCNLTWSNYKADCSKKTLETCLNDILTLDDELNLKMECKTNKANISYSTTVYDYENNQNVDDINVYDYDFEPLSNIHHDFYNKSNILGRVKIYKPKSKKLCNEVELKKPNTICTIPSGINSKNKIQIDYARVNNTLKEAKDFSAELLRLLDKYDKANRDFQSVSEKMKFSHDSNECKKIKDTVRFQFDYLLIGKQNNIYDNILANSMKRVEDVVSMRDRLAIKDFNDRFDVTETNLCSKNYATNTFLHNNVSLVEKDHQSEQNKKIMSDINLVMVKHADGKYLKPYCKDINNLISTEAQAFNKGQKTSDVNSLTKRKEDKSTVESFCFYNTDTTINDSANNDHIIEKETSIRDNFATHIKRAITYEDNTRNQIDIDMSTECVIKHNEEIAFSPDTKTKIVFPSKQDIDDVSEVGSINRTNFHLKNLNFDIPPYGLVIVKNEPKEKNNSVSEQATLEHHSIHKNKDDVSEDGSKNRINFHLNHQEFDIPPYGLLGVKSEPKEKNNSLQAILEHDPNKKHKDKDDASEDGSINRTNFHLNNLDFDIPPYGLIAVKNELKEKNNSVSERATLEHDLNKKHKAEKVITLKSDWSLPRNKTTHVDKESDTRVDYLVGRTRHKIHNQKISGSTIRSGTDSDLDSESRFTELSSNQHSGMSKPKCSCERLKVAFLGGKRVSDHTVMVKWSKPKDLKNVQGYELQVDGRPVQTMIDQSRSMAVVTCLPNSDRVLLTMKTILADGTKSGHEPSVTMIYHPRSKKYKN